MNDAHVELESLESRDRMSRHIVESGKYRELQHQLGISLDEGRWYAEVKTCLENALATRPVIYSARAITELAAMVESEAIGKIWFQIHFQLTYITRCCVGEY